MQTALLIISHFPPCNVHHLPASLKKNPVKKGKERCRAIMANETSTTKVYRMVAISKQGLGESLSFYIYTSIFVMATEATKIPYQSLCAEEGKYFAIYTVLLWHPRTDGNKLCLSTVSFRHLICFRNTRNINTATFLRKNG